MNPAGWYEEDELLAPGILRFDEDEEDWDDGDDGDEDDDEDDDDDDDL